MIDPGFKTFENVLEHWECDKLVSKFSRSDHVNRAGVRNLMSDQIVSDLAFDDRLSSITEAVSGRRLIPFKATLFQKIGRANWLVSWHQDTALPIVNEVGSEGWGPTSLKDGVLFSHAPTWALSSIVALRLHLDASTDNNGPLKVIPGSHRKRITDEAEFNDLIRQPYSVCRAGRGGVIAMSPLLIHASSKCTVNKPRRVLHIEYAPALELAPGVRLAAA